MKALLLLVAIIFISFSIGSRDFRFRKNVESLTRDEWNDLADAFQKMGAISKVFISNNLTYYHQKK